MKLIALEEGRDWFSLQQGVVRGTGSGAENEPSSL